jgi:hypothetical protein
MKAERDELARKRAAVLAEISEQENELADLEKNSGQKSPSTTSALSGDR